MDSKQVSKKIKKDVWPSLQGKGFTIFKGRNAFRFKEDTIDVVNFQSFNSYLANGVGCTTFSFAINLGVYYKCVDSFPWISSKNPPLPQEYVCQARKHLTKSIKQYGLFNPYGKVRFSLGKLKVDRNDRADIWYVLEDGSNLEEVIDDSIAVILEKGIPWLDELSDLTYALKVFLNKPETEFESYSGSFISLGRGRVVSAIAIRLGKHALAKEYLVSILNDPFYSRSQDIQKEVRRVLELLDPE